MSRPRTLTRARLILAAPALAGLLVLAAPQPAAAAAAPATADFNADGKADLAVGIPQAADATIAAAGAVSIAPGSATGSNGAAKITITQNSTVGGVDVPGSSEAGDSFGASTSWGDINGDGRADLAVGAPGEDDTSNTDSGAVSLFYGSATGLTADPTHRLTPVASRTSGDRCGEALTVGDFTADGHADVLVFCPGSYQTWWVDGATGTVQSTAPAQAPEAASAPLSATGAAAATAADVDKDGYVDAVVTFRQWDGTSPLYVLPGSPDGPTTDTAYVLDNAGGASLTTGDLNKDTYPDVIVGQPDDVTGGRITAYYGSATGLDTTRTTVIDQETTGVPGASETGDDMGASVSAGDVNHDGYTDVLTGAPGEDIAVDTVDTPDTGTSLLLYGSATGLTGTNSRALNQDESDTSGSITGSAEPGDTTGTATALLDATGDGYADIALGCAGENTGDGIILMINATTTGFDYANSQGPGIGTFLVPAGAHIGQVLAP
ncbi:hypothetical protein SRB5_53550 [Streptomyces sp. RB5]|uniref:Integrin-like protein n=1 Tax=Streptomyces smaragdinus TaxID=2585196 RepID=A0A7K0CNV8_9ACTN|nr:FG-GAP-like repeat-containing protein [Streptomyces smaragdinus]MQY15177.1 hypothetical protein [Streptomyces smaragdinus]